MITQCSESKLVFHELDSREVKARFDGGEITSDAGGILLREVEKRTRILGRMSECFADHRDRERIEHTVESLVKQRVMGLCLGYEDLNDHDELCRDPMLAVLCESGDVKGERRHRESDRGKALAGKSTLNRLELRPVQEKHKRYRKIEADTACLKDANGFPIPSIVGTNRNLPSSMSNPEMTWFAITDSPLNESSPAAGSVTTLTPESLSLASVSWKLKSASTKVCDEPSKIVTLPSAAVGRAFEAPSASTDPVEGKTELVSGPSGVPASSVKLNFTRNRLPASSATTV